MGEITKSRLMGLDGYVPLFIGNATQSRNPNAIRVDSRYMRPITADANYEMFCGLEGNDYSLDTYLEFALASYYSPAVVQIRPPEADTILPANNPKLADQKLGAILYQEIQVLRFLADTNAVGRYEGMLRFITGRGNVTRAEVEAYYRSGIRALISEIVDGEFNKVSFLMASPAGGFNAVLTRNVQTGEYVLSYGGVNTNGETRTVTGNSLESLQSEMRNGRSKSDFSETSIRDVRTQAALIPAVVLSDSALNEMKNILVNFYINTGSANYDLVKDWYVTYRNSTDNGRCIYLQRAAEAVLAALNEGLKQTVVLDTNRQARPSVLTRDQQQRLAGLR